MIAIRSLILFVALCFCTCPCFSKPTVLVLGDSLSAAFQIPPESGWVALLQDKLKIAYPKAIVINSSIVGDTTANALLRLAPLLEQYHPDIVIIELGGNDGLRGLPIHSIKANLDAMIKLCLSTNTKTLLVGIKLPPNYGVNYTQQFGKIYLELSEEHTIPLVPFILDNVALNPKLMMADRIHPTAQAQPLLLDNIWPYLAPLLAS